MNRREVDYPVELESQFIMRLPIEPAKVLHEALKSGENFKNRLSIQIENDMRYGEVRFDHWLLHAKIVDLPTVVESLKTIDRKSVYKTADICQLMICKDEPEPTPTEEESPNKKKKDPLKVDKKFLWPHGITPPTKNVRKRRFRKTLRKKCMEAPEIEKEVKRLLRADNEAVSVTWEVIQEEDDLKTESSSTNKGEKATKFKKEASSSKVDLEASSSSKVEDIFGGAVSDSDAEDDNVNVDVDKLSSYDDHFFDTNSIYGTSDFKSSNLATQFRPEMFSSAKTLNLPEQQSCNAETRDDTLNLLSSNEQFSVEDYLQPQTSQSEVSYKLQQVGTELEELKKRRQRTQLDLTRMENMALKQRFQDILQTLDQEIMYKEMEYQNLKSKL